MHIRFFCDVRVDEKERWPIDMPVVPRVGDLVESAYTWKINKSPYEWEAGEKNLTRLTLQVTRVTWVHVPQEHNEHWMPVVILDFPKDRFLNAADFQKWYKETTTNKEN